MATEENDFTTNVINQEELQEEETNEDLNEMEEQNVMEEGEFDEDTRAALEEYEREEALKRVQKTPVKAAVKTTKPKTFRYQKKVQGKDDKRLTILEDPEILKFYKGKQADPTHFFYTPEGNLEVRGAKGMPNKVISLRKHFEPLTEPQLVEIMNRRKEQLKEREVGYEAAIQELREQLQRYRAGAVSAEAVVEANRAVLNANKLINGVAYPERWIDLIENPVANEVLMMYSPYEVRRMGYDVFMMKHHDIPMKEAWGTYVEGATPKEEMEGGTIRIQFITDVEDEKTGHFHPFYNRNFTFNETEYCCIYQAYQGERFKQLGKDDLRKQILGTRSGRTMHSIAIQDKTLVNAPQQLWEDILFQFFYQHPDIRKELEATGTDRFHVMDKEVPADYGAILEKVRFKLRELGDKDLDHQEVKERVITEEEQKKAKVGAIIHNFKKKF